MLRFIAATLAASLLAFALSIGAALAEGQPAPGAQEQRGPVHQLVCTFT